MLTRVLSAGLLAGLFAGLAIAILQNFTTTPLIIAAEAFENAEPAQASGSQGLIVRTALSSEAPFVLAHADHGAGAAHGSGSVWAPEEGFERIAFTSATTIAAAIGFAFLLLGGMLIAGNEINERSAMVWAAGGFIATGLAPAVGLPPELPGMAAADLVDRQSWWLLTASMTALSLWMFLSSGDLRMRGLAVVLLLAPHVLGAPHVEGVEAGRVPAELAAHFAAASLAVHAALWLATGFALGTLWPKLAAASQPQAAGQS